MFIGPDGREWDADFIVDITPDNAPNGGNTYEIDTLHVTRVDDADACRRIDAPKDVDEVACDLIYSGAYRELLA